MGLLKTVLLGGKWVQKVFSADTPSHDLAPFQAIKDRWDAKRTAGRIPAWRDFELRDFEGFYGWLSVEDIVSTSPYDSVFRLWGTHWVDVYGRDHTGERYQEIYGPYRTQGGPALWEEMCLTHNIVLGQGSMSWLDMTHRYYGKNYADIVFPLADDHKTVDKYLNVLATVDDDYLTGGH